MDHNEKIFKYSKIIEQCFKSGKKISINHNSTNSTRLIKSERQVIDILDLDNILDLDLNEKTITVEPYVNMETVTDYLLKHGYVLPVTPEFKNITIGGAISGCGEESSSFKFGMLHDNALEYELIMPNGEIKICNNQVNNELFDLIPGTLGTIAILTKIKLRIISAKKFVNIELIKINNFEKLDKYVVTYIQRTDIDFIDLIAFNREETYLILGIMSESQNGSMVFSERWYSEWFYILIKKYSQKGINNFSMPIKDYIFRYDRGAFWMGKYVFKLFKFPFIRIIRMILNKEFRTKDLYFLLHKTNLQNNFIVQDVNVSKNHLVEMLIFAFNDLRVEPIWILPIINKGLPFSSANVDVSDSIVYNIGIWGRRSLNNEENLKLENELLKRKGRKMLYAQQFYRYEDFSRMYLWNSYLDARNKYKSNTIFRDLYEKTSSKNSHDINLWPGIFSYYKKRIKAVLQ